MSEADSNVKWFNVSFYPARKTARAVNYETGVLPRLRQPDITFFTPWGPRYSWQTRGPLIQAADQEIEVLNFLAGLLTEMKQNMPDKQFQWIFLAADLYGTRINFLPEEIVRDYFISLSQRLAEIIPSSELWRWSDLDQEAESFRQQVRTNFDQLLSPRILARATTTARAMGRGSDARQYLVERLAEAMIIEDRLKPIKMSAVGRHKDDGVDANLPRLYFVPERLQAPWL